MRTDRSELGKRIFHATLYELGAVLICAPLFSLIMGSSIRRMALLNIMISVIAVVWNMAFNAVYDRLLARFQATKTFYVRVVHGITFEAGLGLFTIPLSAYWLNISLWQAFLLDAGILLFFLPYTVLFNYAYDAVGKRWANVGSRTSPLKKPPS